MSDTPAPSGYQIIRQNEMDKQPKLVVEYTGATSAQELGVYLQEHPGSITNDPEYHRLLQSALTDTRYALQFANKPDALRFAEEWNKKHR